MFDTMEQRIENAMAPVECNRPGAWTKTVTRERMTAPHYLANAYVLLNARQVVGGRALDFGSRTSILPRLLVAEFMHRVDAVDRDEAVKGQTGPRVDAHVIPNVEKLHDFCTERRATYDLVTAVWAIQHNSAVQQFAIAESLGRLLKERRNMRDQKPAQMIVVSSLVTDRMTYDQKDRADPQTILSIHDWLNCYAIESRLRLADFGFFHYQHSSTVGEFCRFNDTPAPNAVACVLERD